MNTIAERIFDYLKAFPPFNLLTRSQLFAVSERVDVIYLEKDKYLFEIDKPVEDHFYVVRDGAVGLFRENNSLVDECDEGDIFGLRALLRTGLYKLNAKAIEESIVYSISSELLEKYITNNFTLFGVRNKVFDVSCSLCRFAFKKKMIHRSFKIHMPATLLT